MYLGGLKTFAQRERGENGRKTFGHHRFAASRGTNEDDVVATCRRHLESALDVLLSLHIFEIVGEIVLLGIEFLAGVDDGGFERFRFFKESHDVVQMMDSIHFQFVHDRCFASILGWHE